MRHRIALALAALCAIALASLGLSVPAQATPGDLNCPNLGITVNFTPGLTATSTTAINVTASGDAGTVNNPGVGCTSATTNFTGASFTATGTGTASCLPVTGGLKTLGASGTASIKWYNGSTFTGKTSGLAWSVTYTAGGIPVIQGKVTSGPFTGDTLVVGTAVLTGINGACTPSSPLTSFTATADGGLA
ncbi:hypothetical protein ACH4UT_33090 [Streptomyces sp. NPDC020799]|uniref:hypothetical protein n=1 Tax=Streptomyces sp. NPDC020799 TaxID=3365091 RepID=UPI0037A7EC78